MSDREEPYCSILMKVTGATLHCSPDAYARLVFEWTSAKTFIDVVSIDGVEAVIKSAEIQLIENLSSEALESWRVRMAAERARDLVEGA